MYLNATLVFMITLIFRNIFPPSLGNQKHKMNWEEFESIYKKNIFYWLINSFVAKRDLADDKQ